MTENLQSTQPANQPQLQFYNRQRRPVVHPPISYAFLVIIEIFMLMSSIPFIIENTADLSKICTGVISLVSALIAILSHFPIPKFYTFLQSYFAFFQHKSFGSFYWVLLSGSMLPNQNSFVFESTLTGFSRLLPIMTCWLAFLLVMVSMCM